MATEDKKIHQALAPTQEEAQSRPIKRGKSTENFLIHGNFAQAALSIREVRDRVRAGLRADGSLPNFSREKATSVVKAYLEEEAKNRKRKAHSEPSK